MKTIVSLIISAIIYSLFLLPSNFVFSQSNMPMQWQSCYGGSDFDKATDVVETENGYIIIGQTRSNDSNISNYHGGEDLWVVRIDSLGFIEWERCYGGSEDEIEGRIVADSEGNYYISGWVASIDGDVQSYNHGFTDIWVVKINGEGDIIWEKCYGGSGTDGISNIKLLSNGNILITGISTSPDGDLPVNYGYYDSWIFTISPDGEIIQNEVFGNDLHNMVLDAIETNDGGFFFTSTTSSTNGMVNGTYHGGMSDVWAVKLDSTLSIEWQMLYGGSNHDIPVAGLIELSDGLIFLAGTDSNDGDVSGFHGGFEDIWVVRIDLSGNIVWQRCLGGNNDESGYDLFQTDDNGFIVFGSTKSNNGDVFGNHSWDDYYDIWMVKLNSEGEIEWQQCYGGLNDEFIYSGVIKKSDHNWVLAGSTKYPTEDVECEWHGYEDYWVFEIKDTTTNIVNYQGEDSEIKVYPNSARDYINFESSGLSALGINKGNKILITNLLGQPVAQLLFMGDKTTWDCRSISPGIYFCQLQINDKSYTGKFMIIK